MKYYVPTWMPNASPELPGDTPRFNFDANPTVDELIAQQGKSPIKDPRSLMGDFWPEDEPIERFLSALREWR